MLSMKQLLAPRGKIVTCYMKKIAVRKGCLFQILTQFKVTWVSFSVTKRKAPRSLGELRSCTATNPCLPDSSTEIGSVTQVHVCYTETSRPASCVLPALSVLATEGNSQRLRFMKFTPLMTFIISFS